MRRGSGFSGVIDTVGSDPAVSMKVRDALCHHGIIHEDDCLLKKTEGRKSRDTVPLS
jgi:hypothetical protein